MAKKKTDLKYKIEINWSPEDDAYIVSIPELPGLMSHGDTIEQAVKMAHEAVEGYLEGLIDRGLPIPKPLSERKFSGKIPLRVDPNLHRNLAVKAEIEGVSLNKLIETELKKAV